MLRTCIELLHSGIKLNWLKSVVTHKCHIQINVPLHSIGLFSIKLTGYKSQIQTNFVPAFTRADLELNGSQPYNSRLPRRHKFATTLKVGPFYAV